TYHFHSLPTRRSSDLGLFDTDENGELVPNLATDYSISDDNLTYTFQLVENATFHNGAPVTAEDVVYSYSKLAGLETGEPMSDKWAVVETVEANGEYEVEVTLEQADSGFLERTMNAIVPEIGRASCRGLIEVSVV